MKTIDASIVRNIVLGVWFFALIVAPALGDYRFAVAILGIGAVLWSESKRWKRRVVARRQLEEWAKTPIRWESLFVIQDGVGTIDTREHYSVRWEYFDSERAVYYVTQGANTIVISTLAPNAREMLVDALHVANYPCVEWPNFDL